MESATSIEKGTPDPGALQGAAAGGPAPAAADAAAPEAPAAAPAEAGASVPAAARESAAAASAEAAAAAAAPEGGPAKEAGKEGSLGARAEAPAAGAPAEKEVAGVGSHAPATEASAPPQGTAVPSTGAPDRPQDPAEAPAQAAAAPAPVTAAAAAAPAAAAAEEERHAGEEGHPPAKQKAEAAGAKASAKAKGKAPKEPAQALKPATSSREDNLTYDLKHMMALDIGPLHRKTDFYAYTRDTVQMLVNRMFSLPRKTLEEGVVAQLPTEEGFKLPRQKPVPKPKEKTRWQKFMEERNMKKRKRSKLVWDEASGDWKPRWGYLSAKNTAKRANVIREVRLGEDPTANPFAKDAAAQKLLQARQKMREVRNKVEAAGGKIRASVPDLQAGAQRGKAGLQESVRRAQKSSASMGKFDRVAPNEATNLQPKRAKVAQRSLTEEKSHYLKAATKVLAGEVNIDKSKAAKMGARQLEGKGSGKGSIARAAKPAPKRRSKMGGRFAGKKKHGKKK